MTHKFSKNSLDKLQGVHPDLVRVIKRALELSEQDFSITQGVRSASEQKRLVAQSKSQTMNSKHLIQDTGFGHAIDVVPFPVNWDLETFYPIAEAVRKASKELSVKVRWGGAWVLLNNTEKPCSELVREYSDARRRVGNKVFIDAPHFELVQ